MAGRAGRHELAPRRGTGRRAVLITGAAAGAVVLGGGTAAVVSGCSERGGGGTDGGGGILGGGSEATTPAPPRRIFDTLADRGADVPELARIDLSALAEPRAVSFPAVPSARGLSEAVDMSVNKILREQRWAQAAPAELTVKGTVFLTAADTLGVMLAQHDASGDSVSLVYYRGSGDRPFTSPGLVDAAKWGALRDALAAPAKEIEGLDATTLDSCLQQQPRPWGNGPAMLFDSDGDLHVVFPAADVSGKRAEADLEIPADDAAALLSEDGKAVQAAARTPAPFDPASVLGPPPETHAGDEMYVQPVSVPAPQPARQSDGAGPVSQLAPLSGSGVAPSSVAAPDATRLLAASVTFDDGPDPDKNQTLREHLAEHRAAATFYMIGRSVQSFPQWCARTAADGHEIGSHSWAHTQISAQSGEALSTAIVRPADEIAATIGRRPYCMRPPYGARNDRSDDECGTVGESVHIWDVDTLDWQHHDVQKTIGHVRDETRRGSIILMHEIHESTIEAVPGVLETLESKGYTLLTACELGQNQMWAGRNYTTGLVTHEIAAPAPASDGGGTH